MAKITLTTVKFVVKKLAEKKAKDITVIDLRKVNAFVSFFIIATSTSSTQADNLRKTIYEEFSKKKIKNLKTEGDKNSNWILMDCGDLVIHIFGELERKYYNLERLWADGKIMKYS